MKVIFIVIVIYLSIYPVLGCSDNEIQNPKVRVQLIADSIAFKQADSISSNSININGKLNAVSITNNDPLAKNLDVKDKNTTNTIKINGDSNSVNINQNNHLGNIDIQQNGKGNQVIVSQSKTKAISQEE